MTITRSLTRAITHSLTRNLTDPGVGGGGAELISVPGGISVPFGASFYKTGSTYSSDYEPMPFLVEGDPGVTTKYVDVATGNDANPGTSAQPYKTIYGALINNSRATAPSLLLKVKGGEYRITQNFNNSNPEATSLSVVSWDGNPIVCSNELTIAGWTLDGSDTYYATVTGQGSAEYGSTAWDGSTPDAWGDHAPLRPTASIAACKALAGSYYTDTAGGRIYVHCADGRAPDSDIHVFEAWGAPGQYLDFPAAPAVASLYMENVRFLGGSGAFALQQTHASNVTTAVFNGCHFKYARGNQSVSVMGNCLVALVDCAVAANHGDNISYQSYGANPPPNGLEIGCESRLAGCILTPASANQGSTMHNGGTVVRLNGNYHDNQNDQIADVGAGTLAWNLGCTVGDGLESGFSGYRCGNGTGSPSMWLDGCSSSGMTYGVNSDTGCTVYRRDYSGDAGTTGAGTITTY